MKGVDVITFQIENEVQLHSILTAAFRQAIIEFPFSNSKLSVLDGIHANFERNVACGLFRYYTSMVNIPISWKPTTDFFNINYDFSWGDYSFLIMNKSVRKQPALASNDFVLFPALVPNRFENDRWSAKQEGSSNHSQSFIFTFLDNGHSRESHNTYYNPISPELEAWLSILKRRFNGAPVHTSPFNEDWFWSEVGRRGGLPQVTQGYKPSLIITGVCLPEHYCFFSDTDGFSEFAYALYTGKWYEVESPGVLSFQKGAVLSKFKNATCPLAALPSFSELVNG